MKYIEFEDIVRDTEFECLKEEYFVQVISNIGYHYKIFGMVGTMAMFVCDYDKNWASKNLDKKMQKLIEAINLLSQTPIEER